jgi:orotidine-5'-phosphate decarboxylase
MKAKDRLIVALDVDTEAKAVSLAEKLKDDVSIFKIGFELFSSCGPSVARSIAGLGLKVFLDLKFHDIPNTVSRAAVSVTKLGIFMLNLHALGGMEMMKKAAADVKSEAQRLGIERPRIIAVTVLTSMDEKELKKAGIDDNINREVLRLALLAKEAGLDGVVASPKEAALIRKEAGKDFLIVTPGVRPSWSSAGDQKRIATPAHAMRSGADYIVVGRPVTGADDPAAAARKIISEMQ